MKRMMYFELFYLLSFTLAYSQKVSECVCLNDLKSDFQHMLKIQSINKIERYDRFDFDSMKPGRKVSKARQYYEIGFDKNETVLSIEFIDTLIRDAGYKIKIYRSDKFKFFKVSGLRGGKETYKPFLLLGVISTQEYYLINFASETEHGSLNEYTTEQFSMMESIEDISIIMHLGKDLVPAYSIRISGGYIMSQSEFTISADSIEEYIMFLDQKSTESIGKIRGETCFTELRSKAESLSGIELTAKPRVRKDYLDRVWVYGGVHKYR